jgi:hypothetical protein
MRWHDRVCDAPVRSALLAGEVGLEDLQLQLLMVTKAEVIKLVVGLKAIAKELQASWD